MKLSALQTARYEYAPKLPAMLRNGIADICVSEGAETQSVADQEKIQALFPNTYGKKEITFQKGANTSEAKKQVVGVILSGGQAPGGYVLLQTKAVFVGYGENAVLDITAYLVFFPDACGKALKELLK